MTRTSGTLALAALVFLAPAAARASLILLDFEDRIANEVLTATQPYASRGITFSVAAATPARSVIAYDWNTGPLFKPSVRPLVGPKYAAGTLFALDIDASACPPLPDPRISSGNCFNQLSLHYFSGGGSVSIFDASSAIPTVLTLSNSSGTSTAAWLALADALGNTVIDTPGLITRIEFVGGIGAINIDDLQMSMRGTAPGPGLPEPAGFGLVALALAGAGLMGRRKPV